jgi:hypothetical protein
VRPAALKVCTTEAMGPVRMARTLLAVPKSAAETPPGKSVVLLASGDGVPAAANPMLTLGTVPTSLKGSM